MYRGADGCACAVGCLINDEDYDKIIEAVSVQALIDDVIDPGKSMYGPRPVLFPPMYADKPFRELLGDLQHIHDNAPLKPDGRFDLKKMRSHLVQIGNRHQVGVEVLYECDIDDHGVA